MLDLDTLLKKYKQKPSRVLNVFKTVPQILKNISVKDKSVINST